MFDNLEELKLKRDLAHTQLALANDTLSLATKEQEIAALRKNCDAHEERIMDLQDQIKALGG